MYVLHANVKALYTRTDFMYIEHWTNISKFDNLLGVYLYCCNIVLLLLLSNVSTLEDKHCWHHITTLAICSVLDVQSTLGEELWTFQRYQLIVHELLPTRSNRWQGHPEEVKGTRFGRARKEVYGWGVPLVETRCWLHLATDRKNEQKADVEKQRMLHMQSFLSAARAVTVKIPAHAQTDCWGQQMD